MIINSSRGKTKDTTSHREKIDSDIPSTCGFHVSISYRNLS